jgi:hypothetical protein
MVAGDQWPIFLYQGEQYDPDDPWNGLFRSSLLVSVSYLVSKAFIADNLDTGVQTRLYLTKLC